MADAAARAPRRRRFDAVVVGAGHNGLVTAAYLARAGLRTAVVERREIVGGACTTEEFSPGFLASPGAYVLSLLRPAIWRDFSLRARGLEVLEAAPTLNVFRDGARLTLHDDDRETARELARFDRRDAAAYPGFRAELVEIADLLGPWFDRPAPGAPGWLGRDSAAGDRPQRRRGPPPRARGREAVRDLGARPPRAALCVRATPAPRWAGTRSRTRSRGRRRPEPPTRSCTSTRPPRSGGPPGASSAGGWARSPRCSPTPPPRRGPRSSPGRRSSGSSSTDGRVSGVLLAEGGELAAPLVVSNADPKRTLLGLVGPRPARPGDGRGDRGLPLRGREPEDQPRARRAAADRGHARPASRLITAG